MTIQEVSNTRFSNTRCLVHVSELFEVLKFNRIRFFRYLHTPSCYALKTVDRENPEPNASEPADDAEKFMERVNDDFVSHFSFAFLG